MPAKQGSMWSKSPDRDRRDDERAVDLELAEMAERIGLILRSRQPLRRELDAQTQKRDAVLSHDAA